MHPHPIRCRRGRLLVTFRVLGFCRRPESRNPRNFDSKFPQFEHTPPTCPTHQPSPRSSFPSPLYPPAPPRPTMPPIHTSPVTVAVRIRPPPPGHHRVCVSLSSPSTLTLTDPTAMSASLSVVATPGVVNQQPSTASYMRSYKFDHVFGPEGGEREHWTTPEGKLHRASFSAHFPLIFPTLLNF
jgi:hypothetical protein